MTSPLGGAPRRPPLGPDPADDVRNLEAGAAVAAGDARDSFGSIETRGIDIIPDIERKSKPRELFTVFFGPQFGYGNMLFGALAIAFGLGWWAAFTAITVGSVAGSLVFLAVTPVSPKTGTNTQVSSGAAFGVRGRLLGSGITWFIAVGFFIILVYTSGEAIIYTFSRWFGTSKSLTALSVAMIAVLIVTCLSAVLGHRTLERSNRVITVLSIIVGVLIFVVFAGKFHVTHGGQYLLGSFWPTWFLSATTAASLPISWGPFVGDYGRYIPANASSRQVGAYGFAGIFLGCWLGMVAAAFAATSFVGQAGNFVPGFTGTMPAWFLVPALIVLGLGSNISSAGMSLYNASLDIGSWPLFFRVKRWITAVGLSAIVFGLTYIFVVATNFLTNVESFVTIMIVTATPWMVIVGIDFLRRRGQYAPVELHTFAIPGDRGRYWFTHGFQPVAVVAWAVGVGLGLLFSTTSLFTGALESSVQGVDLSWLMAAVGGGLVYLVLITLTRSGADRQAGVFSPADLPQRSAT
jgi:purine-cytosine permease-like protein